MAIGLEQFSQHMAESGVLSAEQVATLQQSLQPTDAEQFAKALVEQQTQHQQDTAKSTVEKSLARLRV